MSSGTAQTASYDYPFDNAGRKAYSRIIVRPATKGLSGPIYNYYSPHGHMGQKIFANRQTNVNESYRLDRSSGSTETNRQTSVLEEAGYVLAMESVFTGMSYLASQNNRWGPAIAGGFDLFIGVAGLQNASLQKTGVQKTGHYLITAGFIVKSLYNLRFGKRHSAKTKFWANFIGFNVLVFTGYYLDTLE